MGTRMINAGALCVVALCIVVAAIGGCWASLTRPHVRATSRGVSLEEFRAGFGVGELPASASNIDWTD